MSLPVIHVGLMWQLFETLISYHRRKRYLSKTGGKQPSRNTTFLHCLTGSNYTTSFHKKERIKPLKLLLKDLETQQVMIIVVENKRLPTVIINKLKKYKVRCEHFMTFGVEG